MRRTRPAFEKSRISAWPERIGVRETRRVQGLRELQGDDVLVGRSDPNARPGPNQAAEKSAFRRLAVRFRLYRFAADQDAGDPVTDRTGAPRPSSMMPFGMVCSRSSGSPRLM